MIEYMPYSPQEKLKIIKYSFKHGIHSTLEAISLDLNRKLSKSTLCRWRKSWKTSVENNYGVGRLDSLKDKSKKPKVYRQPKTNTHIIQFITQIRLKYPTLGKDKLKVLIDEFVLEFNTNKRSKTEYIKTISTSSIGRIILSLKRQRIIPLSNKESRKVSLDGSTGKLVLKVLKKTKTNKLRRKDYIPDNPGDLVQIDCITYMVNRIRRYLICGVDLRSRFTYSYGYKSLSSSTAKDFIIKFQKVFPYKIKHIQTDNGQEFHKHFQDYLKTQKIVQFWNYPKSPKMNAFVERFNRTIQEEYTNFKQWDLLQKIQEFNRNLMDWLIFYNFKRPHLGLKKDYGQFIAPMQYLKQYHQMSHMRWTGTNS